MVFFDIAVEIFKKGIKIHCSDAKRTVTDHREVIVFIFSIDYF